MLNNIRLLMNLHKEQNSIVFNKQLSIIKENNELIENQERKIKENNEIITEKYKNIEEKIENIINEIKEQFTIIYIYILLFTIQISFL